MAISADRHDVGNQDIAASPHLVFNHESNLEPLLVTGPDILDGPRAPKERYLHPEGHFIHLSLPPGPKD